jgi:AcrR family transcriptional regulator
MHILSAALKCFQEEGYHQTGIRSIAARAGVSLGNLYNHFKSKHAILVDIAALEREELRAHVAALGVEGEASEVFKDFVDSFGTHLSKSENVVLTLEIGLEAIRKPDIADMFMGNRDMLIQALKDLLDRGVRSGSFRLFADSEDTAKLILETMEGWAYRKELEHNDDDREKLLEFLSAAITKPTLDTQNVLEFPDRGGA